MSRNIDYFSQGKDSLYLLRERDFGEVLNDTITFFRLFGFQFYKVILFTILPVSLIQGVFIGLFIEDANSLISAILEHQNTSANSMDAIMSWPYFGAIIIGTLEGLAIVTVVYSFFKLYQQGEEGFEVVTVWNEAKKHLVNAFFGSLLLGIILMAILVVVTLIMVAIVTVLNSGLGVFIVFVLTLVMILATIYFALAFSMVLPAIVLEDMGAVSAVMRSWRLVSNRWGQTFLVLVVAYFAIMSMELVFNIPSLLIQEAVSSLDVLESVRDGWMSNTWIILGACISTIGSALITPALHVVIGIQYFNLQEHAEGLGIKSLIDSFGEQASTEEEEEDW